MTVKSLERAVKSAERADVQTQITLVDDGSTDGTSEDVKRIFGDRITVIDGDGNLFWARSMQIAEASVLESSATLGNIDALLWLNDDTFLDDDAISIMINTQQEAQNRIVVGCLREPESERLSYGGFRKSGLHPLRYRQARLDDADRYLDAFNGNCVLVPMDVAKKIGGIDGGYSHSFADIDYGFRCSEAGIPLIATSSTIGTCSRGDRTVDGSLITRWRAFTDVKGGGHRKSITRILRKMSPRAWPLYVVVTYALWWVRNIRVSLGISLKKFSSWQSFFVTTRRRADND